MIMLRSEGKHGVNWKKNHKMEIGSHTNISGHYPRARCCQVLH